MTAGTATAAELAAAFARALAAGDAEPAVADCVDEVTMIMIHPPPGSDGAVRGKEALTELILRPRRPVDSFAGSDPVIHEIVADRSRSPS